MKLTIPTSLLAVALASTASISGVSALANNEPCVTSLARITNDGCNFEIVEELIQDYIDEQGDRCDGRSVEKELSLLLGVSKNSVEEAVNDLCDMAFEAHMSKGGKTIDFIDITEENDVFVEEFFNGGTTWNEGRQTKNKEGKRVYDLEAGVGQKVTDVFETQARSSVIQWPTTLGLDIETFEDCELRAAMCCWVQDRQAGDDNGNCETPYGEECKDADPDDNTDICYMDMSKAPVAARVQSGLSLFPGDDEDGEGDAHCHGFAWSEDEFDPTNMFRGNNLFFVSMYDHLVQRGYVRNVPGAPMCGCVEKMPVVSRSDCTQIDAERIRTEFAYSAGGGFTATVSDVQIEFNSCEGIDTDNDLRDHYRLLRRQGVVSNNEFSKLKKRLVGEDGCDNAIQEIVSQKLNGRRLR